MAKRKQKRQSPGEGLTADKAKEILEHGELHGKPLGDKQRRFMEHAAKGSVDLSKLKKRSNT
jgi:hypothetical protein